MSKQITPSLGLRPHQLGIIDSARISEGQKGQGDQYAVDLPHADGTQRTVTVRFTGDTTQSVQDDQKRQIALLEGIPPNHGEATQRRLEQKQALFDEIVGYDQDGNPRMRVGNIRDRERLSMEIHHLNVARRTEQADLAAANAWRKQKAEQLASNEALIRQKAKERAAEMIQADEIERQAKLIYGAQTGRKHGV